MSSNTIKTLLSLVIIAGSGALAYYMVRGPGPEFNAVAHQAIGRVLAEQAIGLNTGGKFVVLARDTTVHPNPAVETELKAIAETLAAQGQAIGQTNRTKVDPLRLLRFPAGDYAEILRRLNDNDVVISLLGPPEFTDAQVLRVGEKRPKIVALCTGNMPQQVDLKRMFEEQFLHRAVVSRGALTNGYAASAITQPTFEALYAVIDTNNLAELTPYAK